MQLLTPIRAVMGVATIAISTLLVFPVNALAQSNTVTATQDAPDSDDKYNAYVKAFNAVASMFYGGTKGMPDLLTKFKAQNLANRASSSGGEPTLYMNTSMLRNSVDALRIGVSIADSGPYAELDAAAKAMFANGEPLLRLSRQLEDYVTSKKYLEDDFARGRAMDPPYVAGWAKFIEDHDRMGEALETAARASRVARIGSLRGAKENLRAAAAETMLYSSDLIDAFSEPSDFRSKDKTAVGDPLAKKLEKSIEEVRELAQSDDRNASGYDSLADDMSELLGRYRTLKSSMFPSQKDFDELIDRYNRAIRVSNRLP
ncbi:MAG: DUF3829 domain-containing protein [Rhodoferax sp.]